MTIAFRKVKEPYGWMNNMSPHRVEHDGDRYHTAEALFQALRFDDESIRTEIRGQRSPMFAKILAKRLAEQMAVEQRSKADLDNMRLVLRLKIEQHSELAGQLIESGDEEIIEDCTRRPGGSGLFWGAALGDDGVWHGENWLGRLWMERRRDLQAVGRIS